MAWSSKWHEGESFAEEVGDVFSFTFPMEIKKVETCVACGEALTLCSRADHSPEGKSWGCLLHIPTTTRLDVCDTCHKKWVSGSLPAESMKKLLAIILPLLVRSGDENWS
jgi:ribosomal protein L31